MSRTLIDLRRALHRIPELGFEEEKTNACLREELRGVGQSKGIASTPEGRYGRPSSGGSDRP